MNRLHPAVDLRRGLTGDTVTIERQPGETDEHVVIARRTDGELVTAHDIPDGVTATEYAQSIVATWGGRYVPAEDEEAATEPVEHLPFEVRDGMVIVGDHEMTPAKAREQVAALRRAAAHPDAYPDIVPTLLATADALEVAADQLEQPLESPADEQAEHRAALDAAPPIPARRLSCQGLQLIDPDNPIHQGTVRVTGFVEEMARRGGLHVYGCELIGHIPAEEPEPAELPRPITAAEIQPGDVVEDREGDRWTARAVTTTVMAHTPPHGVELTDSPEEVAIDFGPLTLVARAAEDPGTPPSAWMDRDPVEEILPGRIYVTEDGETLLAVGSETARWLVAMDGRTMMRPEVGPLRLAGAIPASLVEALEVEEAIEALTGTRRVPAEPEGSDR